LHLPFAESLYEWGWAGEVLDHKITTLAVWISKPLGMVINNT
jgi:hypothetical protein